MMYQLAQPILARMNPEAAHDLTLRALRLNLMTSDPAPNIGREVRLTDTLTLPNPIGLAAGADKNGEALPAWQAMGFGFVEVGTVTFHPRYGNAKPRVWRLGEDSLVNYMGLPNVGCDGVLGNLLAFKRNNPKMRVGVSIARVAEEDYELGYMARLFCEIADYLAINISCPNLADHGENDLQEQIDQVKSVKKYAGGTPIFVKLAPTDQGTALMETVEAALDAGATGFIATNTAPFRQESKLLRFNEDPIGYPGLHEAGVGGYSGPELLEISYRMISNIRHFAGGDVPIIGVGGIQSVEAAKRLIRAGANAIQLYTGLAVKGPQLLWDIKQALCLCSDDNP